MITSSEKVLVPDVLAGSGITITDNGITKVISATAGIGLAGMVSLNFGNVNKVMTATIADAGVSTTSVILVAIQPNPTFLEMDEAEISQPLVTFGNVVPGVSFDILAHSVDDDIDSRYIVHYARIG